MVSHATKSSVLFALALCASSLVAGCSQKEPAAGSESFFPLRDGIQYTYLHSSNGGWTERVEISAIEDEPTRFRQRQSGNPDGSSSTYVLALDGTRVLRVASDDLQDGELVQTVRYEPGFLRFDDAWADVAPGHVDDSEYERVETPAGATAKPAEQRVQEFTVEAVADTVTVPAGTFYNCVRVRRLRVDAGVDPVTASEDEGKLYWFAPGVGKVREENIVSGKTEVLLTFEVPEA